MESKKKKSFKLKKNDQQFLITAFIFCATASFIAILILRAVYPHKSSENIGTTISGVFGTFLGFFGSVLVFMALRSQIKANKIISNQFKIQQFESQFYEMLRLHKENVNEVTVTETKVIIKTFKSSQSNFFETTGRKAFEQLLIEFEICYYAARRTYVLEDKEFWIDKAYRVFFFGLNSEENELKKNFYDSEDTLILGEDELFCNNLKKDFSTLRTDHLNGNVTFLAHLYRHLYQMVKFVANQDEEFISYEEKRKYLRILRAQLSNPEQALLFYNWKSGFGNKWENENNKFFTDYRMIHNLYDSIIIEDFNLEKIFDINGYFRKEKGRKKDPLFEYLDWRK